MLQFGPWTCARVSHLVRSGVTAWHVLAQLSIVNNEVGNEDGGVGHLLQCGKTLCGTFYGLLLSAHSIGELALR
jgi:hypothetical protein